MQRRATAVLLMLTLCLGYAVSVFPRVEAYYFDDPAKEVLYKKLIDELRCLVCQNQNLADSNAELAQDLRTQVYEMVQGETQAFILT